MKKTESKSNWWAGKTRKKTRAELIEALELLRREIRVELRKHRETGGRLMAAEDILSDLATGCWVSILNQNDNPVSQKMGTRVLNYWRKYSDK